MYLLVLALTVVSSSPALTRYPLASLGWLLILTFRNNRVGSSLLRVMRGEKKSTCKIPSLPSYSSVALVLLLSRNVLCFM